MTTTMEELDEMLNQWKKGRLSKKKILNKLNDLGLELYCADGFFICVIEHQGDVPVFWTIDFQNRDILVG